MRLSDFKFKLPEELIAQFPSRFRDDARLLVLHAKTGEIEHKVVKDLATYFDEGDIVAVDTGRLVDHGVGRVLTIRLVLDFFDGTRPEAIYRLIGVDSRSIG